MRRIRTLTDWLLSNAGNTDHKRRSEYDNIYNKVIYPVANNPLDFKRRIVIGRYKFNRFENRYWMVR